MFITLNGKKQEIRGVMPLSGLLTELKVAERAVAIEVNGNIIPRSEFEDLEIKEGDRIEVLRLIGGG